MRTAISEATRFTVAQRAKHCCEYCRVHEDHFFLSFQVDHIVSLKHGGGNELSNLAYSCPHCNQYKGTDLTTFLDSYSDIEILYNPRLHDWDEHFEAHFGQIVAKTRIGRASVKLFRFNDPDILILRQILAQAGQYPNT